MQEWEVYERIVGPLGPQRGDFHAAEIALTVANSNRGKKGKKLKLSDFLLKWSEQSGGTTSRRRERGALPSGDEDVETTD